jgi:hypothetical protein
MANLNQALKVWKDSGNVEDLLPLLPDLSDVTAVQEYLEDLDEGTREALIADLESLSSAILSHLDSLKSEQSEIRRQMDNSEKSAKACLSYSQTQSPPDKR